MKMFRINVNDIDGMSVETLINKLTGILELDPNAYLTIEEGEIWDTLADTVTPFFEIVCLHKEERGQ